MTRPYLNVKFIIIIINIISLLKYFINIIVKMQLYSCNNHIESVIEMKIIINSNI
jgi:hypothetical protein